MKKLFIFAIAALGLVACQKNNQTQDPEYNDGAIHFRSSRQNMTKASAGKVAADMLGGNFIVEGLKGSETTTGQATGEAIDNYLVVWSQNTAGTTEDNTNDWYYVGVNSSAHMTDAILNGSDFDRKVKTQTIKYWDYSTDNYAFVAYSTGARDMIATGDPVDGTSVKVTKIAHPFGSNAYSFTAASATDFAQCYYTDVTPVAKANYGKPVTLTFKNLSAKVRIGLYETIPGYSVKDVQFYADNTVATPATYTAFTGTLPADQTALTAENGNKQLYKKVGDVYSTYTTYESTLTLADLYTEATPAVADPTAGTNATFFLSGTNVFTEAGTITVSYPLLGTDNASKNGYNKADVSIAPASGSTTTTKSFGALTANYTGKENYEAAGNIYLGRTLATATMAGASTDNYYQYVIPVSTGAALTLRVNYTLVSIDGSGEEIKVWGAKAVLPANYCEWQPNYAYTYIFKISDNTNGSTEKLGGTPEGLFPITFDAVVADITDASAEQATVTTVATPSVTTYQYGHKMGQEYAAGDIYVMSMKDGAPQTITGALIYTVTDNKATEADVIDALQMGTTDGPGNVTGRNGLILTKTDLLSTTVTAIPAVDGTNMTVTSGTAGKFAAAASTNYVFVYDYTTGSPAASEIYSYDAAASTAAPSDWAADATNPYYTKAVVADVTTYTQVTTAWAAGVYYKKYVNNNHTYAVKVIKTGTAY